MSPVLFSPGRTGPGFKGPLPRSAGRVCHGSLDLRFRPGTEPTRIVPRFELVYYGFAFAAAS